MNREPTQSETLSELEWQAFCYVTHEMDTRQIEKFEALLNRDQLARETVARMVKLIDVVHASDHNQATRRSNEPLPPVVTNRPRYSMREVSFFLASVSAILLIAISVRIWTSPTASPRLTTSNERVAIAWAEQINQMNWNLGFEDVLETTESEEDEFASSNEFIDAIRIDLLDESNEENWLFQALILLDELPPQQ